MALHHQLPIYKLASDLASLAADLAKNMPRDRILTETDGPFASGPDGPLRPADAWQAVKELATIWGMPFDEARAHLLDNLRCLSDSGPDHIRSRTSANQRTIA